MHFVAQGVMAGAYDLGIACGVESMTRAPMSSNARGGIGPFSPAFLEACGGVLGIQFWVAQVLADKFGVTREEMDEFSLQSQQRAAENTDNGHFAKEILPVPIRDEEGRATGEVLAADEGIRRSTTLEGLAALPPAWESEDQPAPDITAGNASQMSDGASAMLIADRATAERLGLPIRARFVHFAVLADDPVLVLSAPNPVTRKLLDKTGMKIEDFDAMECNEAFAAIALDVGEGVPARPGEVQPARWGDRDRSPARRQRRAHHDHDAQPSRGHGRPVRVPDHVRGRRPGERHRDRAARLMLATP